MLPVGVLSSTSHTTAPTCALPQCYDQAAHSCSLFQATARSIFGRLAAATAVLALTALPHLHRCRDAVPCPDTRGQKVWSKARAFQSARPPAQDSQLGAGRRRCNMHRTTRLVQLHQGSQQRQGGAGAKDVVREGA
eukprot:SAG25_NODE_23_length_22180_cov_132.152892_14_plen_136_part_00